MKYQLDSFSDLAEMPFFQKSQNHRIKLKPGVIDHKIIDFHTHLGWNLPVGKEHDLWKESAVNYCYPTNSPIDLSRHGALDFGGKLNHKEKEIIGSVINLKKYSRTYTIPNIISEMDDFQVEKSVVLSMKIPLMANNTDNIVKNINMDNRAKKRLVVFASLNPRSLDKGGKLEEWLEQGIRGIKLHPLFNFFRPDSNGSYKIYELAEKNNLIVIFHTGLSPAAPKYLKKFVGIKSYEQAVKNFPRVKFVLGHGGGFSDWEEAIGISNKYQNAYLETSGQPPSVIAEFINKADNNRILYGSDWPFYPMAVSLAKLLLSTKDKNTLKKILFRNAFRLLSV